MNTLTSGLHGVHAYLDDLLVTADTWEQHQTRLRSLFNKLKEYNFTVKLVKSEFGHVTLVYLGHVIGQGKVAPVDMKTEALKSLVTPKDGKALRRFLGMAGFYRHFCKTFAQISAPLTDLVIPKEKFEWNETCQSAFEKIKTVLTSSPVLQLPDFNKPFAIHVDASDIGVGAVLLQEINHIQVWHPVRYYSA